MPKLTSRLYSGPDDLGKMVHLLQMLRDSSQQVYPIAADLHEELADASVHPSVYLWEKATGELVGFCYVSSWQNLVDAFTVSDFSPEIETEMIALAVQSVQHRNRASQKIETLDASALETDEARCAMLERHGFTRQEESSILMARSLHIPIPKVSLPEGFLIRPMGGEPELEAYVALHQAAFGTDNMTIEYRRSIMNAPDYHPELDLIAVTPDGVLAAFCVCQIFPDDLPRAGGVREGWTDPVGTHPRYQNKGLARALIINGMGRLRKYGIDTALMGTASTNKAMQHTAETLGFKIVSNSIWYSKKVT